MNTPKARWGRCLFAFLLDEAAKSSSCHLGCLRRGTIQLCHPITACFKHATPLCHFYGGPSMYHKKSVCLRERNGGTQSSSSAFFRGVVWTPNSWFGRKVQTKFPRCLSVSTQSDLFCQRGGTLSLSLSFSAYLQFIFNFLYFTLLDSFAVWCFLLRCFWPHLRK